MIYCLVPEPPAGELLALLREHYRHQLGVKVIVDRRVSERGASLGSGQPHEGWSRRGRPLQDRRRPVVPRDFTADLPPELAARASSVRWLQRLGPVRRELARADLDA